MKKGYFFIALVLIAVMLSCKKEATSTSKNIGLPSVKPEYIQTKSETKSVAEKPQEVKPAPPADGKYPEMSFDVREHDFGTIKQGAKVVHVFKFKNSGDANLIISDARGSCGCTVPDYPKTPIKPGEKGEIKVSFNSEGKSGEQTKTVTLSCNTKEGKEVLKIKSTIIPQGKN